MNSLLKRLTPLLLLIFIDSFSYFVVIPILLQLFFQDSFGLLPSDTTLTQRNLLTSFAISISTFAALISAPFIGSLSDKYGRKITLLTCLSIMAFGFLLPIIGFYKKSIVLILLGRTVSGIGSVSQPVAQAAVADICDHKEKSIALSWIAMMMTLPLIVGPLVGGYLSNNHLVSWFGITTPYWMAFLLSIINFALIIFYFKETLNRGLASKTESIFTTIAKLKNVAQRYRIGALLLAFFLMELAWSQYYQASPLFLTHAAHYTAQQVGLFHAYLGIIMTLSLLVVYPLLNRYIVPKRLALHGTLLVLLGLMGCTLFPSAPFQWAFASLVAMFAGCTYVSLLTCISNQTPPNQQGFIMGYTSTILFLAWMLTGFGSGWLISIKLLLPFYVATLASIICLLSLLKQRHTIEDKLIVSG